MLWRVLGNRNGRTFTLIVDAVDEAKAIKLCNHRPYNICGIYPAAPNAVESTFKTFDEVERDADARSRHGQIERPATGVSTLETLMSLAVQQKCAFITYQKPYDAESTKRLIEPYDLQQHAGNLMVRAWQVDPDTGEREAWRNFRLDRIVSITDSGASFKPRVRQSMLDGEVKDWKMEEEVIVDPIEIYERTLVAALRDKRIQKHELQEIMAAKAALTPGEMRAVHARVYASELEDIAMDDDIDESEMKYAKDLRGFLQHLGWAP